MTDEKIIYPDYNKTLTYLSASILNRFGIKTSRNTISQVDEIFHQYFKHIIVISVKGFEKTQIDRVFGQYDFFQKRLLKEFPSDFPEIPVSENGEFPAVDLEFSSKHFAESITKTIQESGQGWGHVLFSSDYENDLYKWISEIKKTTETDDQTVTYACWEKLEDDLMEWGDNSLVIDKQLRELNNVFQSMCNSLRDSVIFITGDYDFVLKPEVSVPLIWFESKRKPRKNGNRYGRMLGGRHDTGVIGWITVAVIVALIAIFIILGIY